MQYSINFDLLKIRLKKLAVASVNPCCWRALAMGVAPSVEHLRVLRPLVIDGIIDVGANRGQFSLAALLEKRGVPIVAFEPIPTEAAIFRRVHGKQQNIQLIESALGETTGRATLHLSESADSSSLLPIGRHQTDLFQGTCEVGTIEVGVQRLDDLGNHWPGRSRQLLKLDVQGFELSVLRGAINTLQSCSYVYAECSEIPLYTGQALRAEVEGFLLQRGFALQGRFNPLFVDGQLVQADYLFYRR